MEEIASGTAEEPELGTCRLLWDDVGMRRDMIRGGRHPKCLATYIGSAPASTVYQKQNAQKNLKF